MSTKWYKSVVIRYIWNHLVYLSLGIAVTREWVSNVLHGKTLKRWFIPLYTLIVCARCIFFSSQKYPEPHLEGWRSFVCEMKVAAIAYLNELLAWRPFPKKHSRCPKLLGTSQYRSLKCDFQVIKMPILHTTILKGRKYTAHCNISNNLLPV